MPSMRLGRIGFERGIEAKVLYVRPGCVIDPRQIAVTAIETAALRESLGVSETQKL